MKNLIKCDYIYKIKEKSFLNIFFFYVIIISINIKFIFKFYQIIQNYLSHIIYKYSDSPIINSNNIDELYIFNFTYLSHFDNYKTEENYDDYNEISNIEIKEEEITIFNYSTDNENEEININKENERFGYNQTIDDDTDEYNQMNNDGYYEEEFENFENEEFEDNEESDNIDDCDIIKQLNGTCNMTNITKISNITGEIIEQIEEGNLNYLFERAIKSSEPQVINSNNAIYQFTTVLSQQKICNKEYNYSSIDFYEFSDIFKRRLDEFSNDFYLFKIDYFLDDYKIPVIEYNIYNKVGKELQKINLDNFKDKHVRYYLPVSINQEDEFRYNPTNNYFNDICYSYDADNGKDKILYERKDEFNKLKMSLCEKDCIYIKYDFNINKVICECKIKSEMKYSDTIIINEAFYQFTNLKMLSNIYILKCAKTLFSKDGIKSNIAFYIILIIILFSIFECIYFFLKGYKYFERKIKDIIELRSIFYEEQFKKKIKSKKFPRKMLAFYKINSIKKDKIEQNDSNSKTGIMKEDKNSINDDQIQEIKDINTTNKNNENNKDDFNFYENDYEKNNLPYELALKDDQKSYWDYYFSLIRSKHLIVLTFYTNNDYNSRILKISLFLLMFAIHYFVNAFFLNDSIINKIYKNPKKYALSISLPIIIYSVIISYAARYVLKMLTFTENSIIEIKNQRTLQQSSNLKEKILKQINIKIIIFYSINFILLVFIWYYLSCFGVAFRNTQYILFWNTLIGMVISLIFPFIYLLVPGILRIQSFKNNNENLYKISQLFQLLL